jgi:ABC-type uncharacterized transport system substrate-binding protein
MTLRTPIWVLATLLLITGSLAHAQQPQKIPRIGYLVTSGDPTNPGPSVDAFRQGLQDLGYVEGKDILVEYRYVEGKSDRIPSFVAEFKQLKVDVLVVTNPPSIRTAKEATKTIPIVMVSSADPVATGIIDSLARPGGNITGVKRKTPRIGQGGHSGSHARRDSLGSGTVCKF